jgi:hypothetical protein
LKIKEKQFSSPYFNTLKTLVISEFGGKTTTTKKKPHVYRGMEF